MTHKDLCILAWWMNYFYKGFFHLPGITNGFCPAQTDATISSHHYPEVQLSVRAHSAPYWSIVVITCYQLSVRSVLFRFSFLTRCLCWTSTVLFLLTLQDQPSHRPKGIVTLETLETWNILEMMRVCHFLKMFLTPLYSLITLSNFFQIAVPQCLDHSLLSPMWQGRQPAQRNHKNPPW